MPTYMWFLMKIVFFIFETNLQEKVRVNQLSYNYNYFEIHKNTFMGFLYFQHDLKIKYISILWIQKIFEDADCPSARFLLHIHYESNLCKDKYHRKIPNLIFLQVYSFDEKIIQLSFTIIPY